MSENITVYIVEDDLITRSQIKGYLISAGYEVAGQATDAETAWTEIQACGPDMVIVDINLSGEKDGLWLGAQLGQKGDIPFIFLTAHNDKETIQEAAKLKPNGYLIKPFVDMGLYSAMEVALQNFSSPLAATTPDEPAAHQIVVKDSLFIKVDHLLVKVKFDALLFVMSEGNYLELHLNDQKYLIRSKLSTFAEQLPPSQFIQVHLRYLVNQEKIQSIGSSFLQINNKEIPISKSYKDELMRRIQSY